jgi:hypothetical protein
VVTAQDRSQWGQANPHTLARLVGAIVVGLLCGADEARDEDPPVVGRPADLPFSEAIGRFRAQARAAPTMVEAEDPLTLTLIIEAVAAVRRPPQRIDLREIAGFADAFHIDNLEDSRPTPDSWEFTYRLRPRRMDVSEIPGIPVVYFDPEIRPASKGYQVRYTEPIPLQVRPRQAVAVPLAVPPGALELGTGPEVLARRQAWPAPSPLVILAVLVIPPFACVAWYLCWRRMYPDAARQAQHRRSRAATRALQRLAQTRRLAPAEQAAALAAAVSDYLHERFDLRAREPTPTEVQGLLGRYALPVAISDEAGSFYRECDAQRFLPAVAAKADLRGWGTRLILEIEGATCPESSSS